MKLGLKKWTWSEFEAMWSGLFFGVLFGLYVGAWVGPSRWLGVPRLLYVGTPVATVIAWLPQMIGQLVRGVRTFRAASRRQPHL